MVMARNLSFHHIHCVTLFLCVCVCEEEEVLWDDRRRKKKRESCLMLDYSADGKQGEDRTTGGN